MLYAISWLIVAFLLVLWSLTAWAFQALAVWAVSHAGALSGAATGATSTAAAISLPQWLAPWLPAEAIQLLSQLTVSLAPLVDGLLQAAPALAGGLTLAAWVIWGIGCLLVLLLGVGLHLFIALRRRHRSNPP